MRIRVTEKVFNFPKEYNIPSNIDEVEIITFHFNPTQSTRLTENYYDFEYCLKNLKEYINCYEIVFDDRKPEIKNSTEIKASLRKSCMWQSGRKCWN